MASILASPWAMEFSQRAVAILIDVGVKGCLLMMLVSLLVLALRRKSAAMRHLVLALGMAGLFILPVLSLTMPKWQLPILPEKWVDARIVSAPRPIFPPKVNAQPAALGSETNPHNPVSPLPVPSSHSSETSTVSVAERSTSSDTWIFVFWLLVVSVAILPLLIGHVILIRLLRKSKQLDDESWNALIRSLAGSLGLHGSVRVLQTTGSTMPMAVGLLRPTVLLPINFTEWSEEKKRAVLLHELAHIKRRDCLTHTLARLACTFHWFNPLAWWALRRLITERERACDDLVLTVGSRPSDYADHLLDIARTMRTSALTSAAAITMARKSQLEGRLLAVLDVTRDRRPVGKRLILVACFMALTASLILGAIRLTSSNPVEDSSIASRVMDEGENTYILTPEQFNEQKVLDIRTGKFMIRERSTAYFSWVRLAGDRFKDTAGLEWHGIYTATGPVKPIVLKDLKAPEKNIERYGNRDVPIRDLWAIDRSEDLPSFNESHSMTMVASPFADPAVEVEIRWPVPYQWAFKSVHGDLGVMEVTDIQANHLTFRYKLLKRGNYEQQFHIVMPISTELQRMLLGDTKATDFVLINGNALVNQDGTINSDVLDVDALRNALTHAPPGKGGVYFSAVYKNTVYKDGVPRTAVDTVDLLLKGFASHYAGISNVKVSDTFSNGGDPWQDMVNLLANQRISDENNDDSAKGKLVAVYRARKVLSRYLISDADCLVDILPPINEAELGATIDTLPPINEAELDTTNEEDILAQLSKLKLEKKHKILFRTAQIEEDILAHLSKLKLEKKHKIAFRISQEEWGRYTVDKLVIETGEQMAKSLGFETSSILVY